MRAAQQHLRKWRHERVGVRRDSRSRHERENRDVQVRSAKPVGRKRPALTVVARPVAAADFGDDADPAVDVSSCGDCPAGGKAVRRGGGLRGALSHDLWLPPTSVTTPIQLLTFPVAETAKPAGKLSDRVVSCMNVY